MVFSKHAIIVSAIVGSASFSSAFAQQKDTDPKVDSPSATTTENKTESAVKKEPAVNTPKKDSEIKENSSENKFENGGGFLFPMARIGGTVTVDVPHLLTYELEAMAYKSVGVAAAFGGLPSDLNITNTTKAGMSYWDVKGRWFPFKGSFFIGGAFGSQSIYAKASEKFSTTAAPTVLVPVDIKVDVTTLYAGPQIGWFAVWDCGFTLGFDLGWQLPLSTSTKVNVTSNDPTAQAALDIIKTQDDYKKTEKDVKDAGDLLGKGINGLGLPYIGIFRIGWML